MIELRVERPEDAAAIREVLQLAFLRPAEADLVDELRDAGAMVLSLVAVEAAEVVGHVLYSHATLDTEDGGQVTLLALAPVAVSPLWQGQGIGTQLVQSSLERLRDQGHPAVVVLGSPGFYSRFGFSPADAWGIRWEMGAPEYFMAVELAAGSLAGLSGVVRFRPEFAGV